MSTNDMPPIAAKERVAPRDAAPVTALLWGQFAMSAGRGYLLIVFTQALYRSSKGLWYNLFYVASGAVFAFVVPLLAGAWVDRHGPRALLVRSAAAIGVVLAACAGLASMGWMSAAGALGTTLVIGMLDASVRVCLFTLTPVLAAEVGLIRVNGRQQVAFQTGTLAGVLLAGALVDRAGASASYLLTAACAALAAACYARAARVADCAPASQPARNARAGFLRLVPALFGTPMLIVLFALGACDLIAISVFNLTLPVLAAKHFEGHSSALAAIDSAYTVGSAALGWVVGRFSLKGRQLHHLLLLMPFAFAGVVAQTVWFNRPLCIALAFATGFLVASYTVYFTATVQALVPASLRGRFAALSRMMSSSIVALASYAYTLAYARAGAHGASVATAVIACAVLAACGTWIWSRRRTRTRAAGGDGGGDRDVGEHADLLPLFAPFIQLASLDRRSAS
jgi:MFS family permease